MSLENKNTFGIDGLDTNIRPIIFEVYEAEFDNSSDNLALTNLKSRLDNLRQNSVRNTSPTLNLYSGKSTIYRAPRKLQGLSIMIAGFLLIISMLFGFGVALQLRNNQAVTRPAVAGVQESTTDNSTTYSNQSIEDLESWLESYYQKNGIELSIQKNQENSTITPELLDSEINSSTIQNKPKSSIQELYNQQLSTVSDSTQNLETIKKIDAYLFAFRSEEEFDNQVTTPINGSQYLATSIQTSIPIESLIAISRLETRFGTDQFTSKGNLNNTSKSKNICNIGSEMKENALAFSTWEEGLLGCGVWYKFLNERGISDCQKWDMLKPNQKYCAKISSLNKEITEFLAIKSAE